MLTIGKPPATRQGWLESMCRRLAWAFPEPQAKEGAADTFQGSESNGPVRKYYRLTGEGRTRLAEMTGDWRNLQVIMARLGIT